jgi:hypothetical protein
MNPARVASSSARRGCRTAVLTAGCGALLAACAGGPLADLAIENVTVIDAVHGVRPGQTVLVHDGRIAAVRTAGEPSGAAEVLDGTGRYLIPGLWDFHVHLTYDERFTAAMPGLFLRWGITSIRDTGGELEKVLPVVAAMRAEGALAPRVLFAGPLLDGESVVYDGQGRPALGIANPDVETARRNVARLAEAGVDFIKVYELVTPEVFHALVAAAGELGLPIDAHVPLSMLAREVAPHVNSLEHLRNIELDCAGGGDELLAERRAILADHEEGSGSGLRSQLHRAQRMPAIAAYDPARCGAVLDAMAATIQVPTLRLNALALRPPYARADWDSALTRTPATVAEAWGATAERWRSGLRSADTTFAAWSLFLVGEMHGRGIPVAAGTDTPISQAIPGYSLHNELELLVSAGLSPLEALGAATLHPAAFFGLERELGTVEEGRLADLVLLAADPLADIGNTRTVEAVIAAGRLLRLPDLERLTR